MYKSLPEGGLSIRSCVSLFGPRKYKVVQIWPGLTGNYGLKLWFKNGLKLWFKKISPGHIWTTMYMRGVYNKLGHLLQHKVADTHVKQPRQFVKSLTL